MEPRRRLVLPAVRGDDHVPALVAPVRERSHPGLARAASGRAEDERWDADQPVSQPPVGALVDGLVESEERARDGHCRRVRSNPVRQVHDGGARLEAARTAAASGGTCALGTRDRYGGSGGGHAVQGNGPRTPGRRTAPGCSRSPPRPPAWRSALAMPPRAPADPPPGGGMSSRRAPTGPRSIRRMTGSASWPSGADRAAQSSTGRRYSRSRAYRGSSPSKSPLARGERPPDARCPIHPANGAERPVRSRGAVKARRTARTRGPRSRPGPSRQSCHASAGLSTTGVAHAAQRHFMSRLSSTRKLTSSRRHVAQRVVSGTSIAFRNAHGRTSRETGGGRRSCVAGRFMATTSSLATAYNAAGAQGLGPVGLKGGRSVGERPPDARRASHRRRAERPVRSRGRGRQGGC